MDNDLSSYSQAINMEVFFFTHIYPLKTDDIASVARLYHETFTRENHRPLFQDFHEL